MEATAVASPNIALIKYWGNRDEALRLPSCGSISMTLDTLQTRVHVRFDSSLPADRVIIQGTQASPEAAARVSAHLDLVRDLAGLKYAALVDSMSNFPLGAGLASSAAAFAALTLAATAAAGLQLDPQPLSRLSRRGSGSACRSIFGGYVEWHAGQDDTTSFAEPIAPPDHWDLVDLIAMVHWEHKAVGSSVGHSLAATSPLQATRIADAPRRLAECRQAILERDFPRLAAVAELDSNLMHAIMLTSTPPLIYWSPATLTVMHAVTQARQAGLEVFYTIDAGPNVHCLCPASQAEGVLAELRRLPVVLDVLRCRPGGPAWLV
ncbi:MAG: diphosphomevalonate decarboxylase [Chloroflexota bacterium]